MTPISSASTVKQVVIAQLAIGYSCRHRPTLEDGRTANPEYLALVDMLVTDLQDIPEQALRLGMTKFRRAWRKAYWPTSGELRPFMIEAEYEIRKPALPAPEAHSERYGQKWAEVAMKSQIASAAFAEGWGRILYDWFLKHPDRYPSTSDQNTMRAADRKVRTILENLEAIEDPDAIEIKFRQMARDRIATEAEMKERFANV